MNEKLNKQIEIKPYKDLKIPRLIDEYELKLTIHSVQINIPPSIKMVVQTTYNPNQQSDDKAQVSQTGQKCKIAIISTVNQNSPENESQLKIADFKNQELKIKVNTFSKIDYIKKYQQKETIREKAQAVEPYEV